MINYLSVQGWAGIDNRIIYVCNIFGSQTDTKPNGQFYLAGTYPVSWNTRGVWQKLTVTKDADATSRAVLTAYVLYSNAMRRDVHALATISVTKPPAGVASVGVKIVEFESGAVLYAGDLDGDGKINEVPLFHGGVLIQ